MGGSRRIRVAVGVIVAVAAAGVGIRFWVGARQEPPVRPEGAATEQAGAGEAGAAEAGRDAEAEYEEFMTCLEEAAAEADASEEEQTAAEAVVEEPEDAGAEETPPPAIPAVQDLFGDARQRAGQAAGSNMPRWRAIWSDLNLTQEERARLRQGFGLWMARWASMPPEAQAAERARLQEMRVRWQGMNDDERAAASQRVRDRFEAWRASGQVELPELSLD